jgi:SAM-dependent methyltransferase
VLIADFEDALQFHRFLLGETNVRLERFRAAIAATVRPGDVVLDLGTGVGILAFFACLAGARRVYAVEASPVVDVARLVARENGFAERVTFVGGSSRDLDLPEQADVLVTDTFGRCGLAGDGLRAIVEARQRCLRPGGAVVPSTIDIVLAPVELPAIYERAIDFWSQAHHGIDLSAVRPFAVNNRHAVRLDALALLAPAERLAHFDLAHIDDDLVQATVCMTVRRQGTLHGLCCWFAAALADGIELGNEPGRSTTNYAQALFPIDRPVAVDDQDRVRARVTTWHGVEFRWQVDVLSAGAAAPRVSFDQSTFAGTPLSAASLRALARSDTPALSARGGAERLVLELIDGGRSVAEMARQVRERYPNAIQSDDDAAGFVREVIDRCT